MDYECIYSILPVGNRKQPYFYQPIEQPMKKLMLLSQVLSRNETSSPVLNEQLGNNILKPALKDAKTIPYKVSFQISMSETCK